MNSDFVVERFMVLVHRAFIICDHRLKKRGIPSALPYLSFRLPALGLMGIMLLTSDVRAPNALTIEKRKKVDTDPKVAQLLVKRAQIRKFLQQKYRSVARAIQSSDPAAFADYNTFVKSKRDLDVASRRVRHQALKKVKAEWWASVNASNINDGLSQAAPALSRVVLQMCRNHHHPFDQLQTYSSPKTPFPIENLKWWKRYCV